MPGQFSPILHSPCLILPHAHRPPISAGITIPAQEVTCCSLTQRPPRMCQQRADTPSKSTQPSGHSRLGDYVHLVADGHRPQAPRRPTNCLVQRVLMSCIYWCVFASRSLRTAKNNITHRRIGAAPCPSRQLPSAAPTLRRVSGGPPVTSSRPLTDVCAAPDACFFHAPPFRALAKPL